MRNFEKFLKMFKKIIMKLNGIFIDSKVYIFFNIKLKKSNNLQLTFCSDYLNFEMNNTSTGWA